MPINLKTVYTKERLLRFNDYLVRSKKFFWGFMILTSLLMLAMSVFALRIAAMNWEMIICLCTVLAIDLISVFGYLILPRITVGKQKNLDIEIEYSVGDDGIEIKAANEYGDEHSNVRYSALNRVRVNREDLYLFVGRYQAFILDLSRLSGAERLALRTLLMAKLPEKKIKWEL